MKKKILQRVKDVVWENLAPLSSCIRRMLDTLDTLEMKTSFIETMGGRARRKCRNKQLKKKKKKESATTACCMSVSSSLNISLVVPTQVLIETTDRVLEQELHAVHPLLSSPRLSSQQDQHRRDEDNE